MSNYFRSQHTNLSLDSVTSSAVAPPACTIFLGPNNGAIHSYQISKAMEETELVSISKSFALSFLTKSFNLCLLKVTSSSSINVNVELRSSPTAANNNPYAEFEPHLLETVVSY